MPRLKDGHRTLASLPDRAAFHFGEADALREGADAHDAAADFIRENPNGMRGVCDIITAEAACARLQRRAHAHEMAGVRLTARADLARFVEIGAAAVTAGDVDGNAADGEPETGLVDTLACLMHWADAHGLDWDDALRTAEVHWSAESRRI